MKSARLPLALIVTSTEHRASQRAITRGLVWVFFFVLIAKVAGAGKEVALAARFGVGPTVDAYGLVFAAAMLPMGICLSVFTAVVVPLEAKLAHEAPELRQRFRQELLGATIALGLVVTVLLMIVLPLLASATATPSVAGVAREMAPGLAVAGGLGALVALYSAWILASGRHLNSALDGVTSIVLLGVILLAPVASASWLVLGTVLGLTLHMALAMGAQSRHSGVVVPAARFASPAWRHFGSAMGLMLVAQAMSSATSMLEVLIAARLGEGAVSVLGYANRLLALFSGLVALVITRALMPVLTNSHLRRPRETRQLIHGWLVRALWAGLVLGGLLAFSSEPLTRLVLERGQFSAEDTARVADVLRFASSQLPVLLPSLVLSSYAAASRRYRLLLLTGVSTIICVPFAGWTLSQVMGLQGLVLAPALSLLITSLIFWFGLGMSVRDAS